MRDDVYVHGHLEALRQQRSLDKTASRQLFEALVEGQLCETEIRDLLVGFIEKDPEPPEVAGAMEALRSSARAFSAPQGLFADTCGTGGDGFHTVNVSTAVAFVVAAAGLPVAKHGNRSLSSKCGSADVLAAVGVELSPSPEIARLCLDRAGICFLYAPLYHPGLRHAGPVRKQLKLRTVMNLLGPLVNPARPPIQMVGVYDPRVIPLVAESLQLSGCRSALVVHGAGLDELALHAPSLCAYVHDGKIEPLTIDPQALGLAPAPIEALRGGTPEENGHWLVELLSGRGSRAHNDFVALNAGALLWLAKPQSTLVSCVQRAQNILREGQGLRCLRQLAQYSQLQPTDLEDSRIK